MLPFCGQERCLVDGNGRIRLTQRWVDDFMRRCGGEVVIHGLPEGGLALYPEDVYRDMRAQEIGKFEQLGTSFALRRSLRRFGALTCVDTITRQGRITLPAPFREYAGIAPGSEICLVGVEVGVEIWDQEKFAAEMRAIAEHLTKWREVEMARELQLEKER